ncbi:hypothetical protein ACH4VR_29240 [Streptomyces sp. NPDC020883]|uniref:hypothetical protein n=1 Tax=Streptomyces sp. NPDC020883 TaxID=3365099 RepID=UPI0037A24D5C
MAVLARIVDPGTSASSRGRQVRKPKIAEGWAATTTRERPAIAITAAGNTIHFWHQAGMPKLACDVEFHVVGDVLKRKIDCNRKVTVLGHVTLETPAQRFDRFHLHQLAPTSQWEPLDRARALRPSLRVRLLDPESPFQPLGQPKNRNAPPEPTFVTATLENQHSDGSWQARTPDGRNLILTDDHILAVEYGETVKVASNETTPAPSQTISDLPEDLRSRLLKLGYADRNDRWESRITATDEVVIISEPHSWHQVAEVKPYCIRLSDVGTFSYHHILARRRDGVVTTVLDITAHSAPRTHEAPAAPPIGGPIGEMTAEKITQELSDLDTWRQLASPHADNPEIASYLLRVGDRARTLDYALKSHSATQPPHASATPALPPITDQRFQQPADLVAHLRDAAPRSQIADQAKEEQQAAFCRTMARRADAQHVLIPAAHGRLAVVQVRPGNWQVRTPHRLRSLGPATHVASQRLALDLASRMENIRDAAGNPFPWSDPWADLRIRAFRDAQGRLLAAVLQQVRQEHEADQRQRLALLHRLHTAVIRRTHHQARQTPLHAAKLTPRQLPSPPRGSHTTEPAAEQEGQPSHPVTAHTAALEAPRTPAHSPADHTQERHTTPTHTQPSDDDHQGDTASHDADPAWGETPMDEVPLLGAAPADPLTNLPEETAQQAAHQANLGREDVEPAGWTTPLDHIPPLGTVDAQPSTDLHADSAWTTAADDIPLLAGGTPASHTTPMASEQSPAASPRPSHQTPQTAQPAESSTSARTQTNRAPGITARQHMQSAGTEYRPATTERTAYRVWIQLDSNDPKAEDLKRWFNDKNNGVGLILHDPTTRRYYYVKGKREIGAAQNGRRSTIRIDNRRSLEEAQQRIDAYLADLYQHEGIEDGQGRLVPEHEPQEVPATNAHKTTRPEDDEAGPAQGADQASGHGRASGGVPAVDDDAVIAQTVQNARTATPKSSADDDPGRLLPAIPGEPDITLATASSPTTSDATTRAKDGAKTRHEGNPSSSSTAHPPTPAQQPTTNSPLVQAEDTTQDPTQPDNAWTTAADDIPLLGAETPAHQATLTSPAQSSPATPQPCPQRPTTATPAETSTSGLPRTNKDPGITASGTTHDSRQEPQAESTVDTSPAQPAPRAAAEETEPQPKPVEAAPAGKPTPRQIEALRTGGTHERGIIEPSADRRIHEGLVGRGLADWVAPEKIGHSVWGAALCVITQAGRDYLARLAPTEVTARADDGRYMSPEELAEGQGQGGVISAEVEAAIFGSNRKERIAQLASQTDQRSRGSGLAPQTWYKGRYVGFVRRAGMKQQHWDAHLPFSDAPAPVFAKYESALAYLALASEAHDNYSDLTRISPQQRAGFRFLDIDLGDRDRDVSAIVRDPKAQAHLRALHEVTGALRNGQSPRGNVADDLGHAIDEARWLYEHLPRSGQAEDRLLDRLGRLIGRCSELLDILRPEDHRSQHHVVQRNLDAAAYLRAHSSKDAKAQASTVTPDALRNGDLVMLSGVREGRFGPNRWTGYVIGAPVRGTAEINGKGPVSGWRITIAEDPFDPPGWHSTRHTCLIPDKNKGITRFARAEDTGLPTDDIIRWRAPDTSPRTLAPPAMSSSSISGFDQLDLFGYTGKPEQEPTDVEVTSSKGSLEGEAHLHRQDRAAKQFLNELQANAGDIRAERVPVGEIRQGDIVHLEGRITGLYPGATGDNTGYVVGKPSKATLTTYGRRQNAWRITVSPSPRADLGIDSNTFIIPAGEYVRRIALADDVRLPVDQHTYGRRVGDLDAATYPRDLPSDDAKAIAETSTPEITRQGSEPDLPVTARADMVDNSPIDPAERAPDEVPEPKQRSDGEETNVAPPAAPAIPEPSITLATPPTSTWDGPEPLQQSEQRFGGSDQLAHYAQRADVVPTSASSSTIWLDGRLIGYVADLNKTVGAAHDQSWPAELRRPPGPRFESRPVFGHRDAVSALLEDGRAAVAELVARALQVPVPREAIDADTAWTLNATLGTIRLSPAYAGDDPEAAERLSALQQVVENLSAGQLTSADLADDLALAHDGLLWAADLPNRAPNTSAPYMIRAAEELAVLLAATRPDDARAWRPDPPATDDRALPADAWQSAEAPAPNRPTKRTRTQEGGRAVPQRAETEQLGLFGDPTPDPTDRQGEPDTSRPASAGIEEEASDDLVRAQLRRTEVSGAAGIQYSLYGSWRPSQPETIQFHIVRLSRGLTDTTDFSGTRDQCLAYIESEAAVRSAAEAVDENSEQQAAALAWLREAPAADPAAPEETALPDLDVVLLNVDGPPLDPAEPYATDTEAQVDIDQLGEAFAQWDALPTIQRYYDADRQQRPDGSGDPTNPVAQLAQAYRHAEQTLRDGPVGSPDDLVRQVHTVAAWSRALEPVVGEDLRGPLRQVREAAGLLASRTRATVESFQAEPTAFAANSAKQSADTNSAEAETETVEQSPAESPPAQQAPVDVEAVPSAPEEAGQALPGAQPAVDLPDIEDPPEQQSYTETIPLTADPSYVLLLSGLDGEGPQSGELLHGDVTIATVERTDGGEWFARIAGDIPNADTTTPCATPREAAHQGPILYSVLTGTPYGTQPTAAPGQSPQDRAQVLRTELRDAANQHQAAISHAATETSLAAEHLHHQALTARLGKMAQAVSLSHTSLEMAAQLGAAAELVDAWRSALPADLASDERRALAYPLAHLRYDLTRLHTRLQATLDVVRAEQAAAAAAQPKPKTNVNQTPSPGAAGAPTTAADSATAISQPHTMQPATASPSTPASPDLASSREGPAPQSTPGAQAALHPSAAPAPLATGAPSPAEESAPAQAPTDLPHDDAATAADKPPTQPLPMYDAQKPAAQSTPDSTRDEHNTRALNDELLQQHHTTQSNRSQTTKGAQPAPSNTARHTPPSPPTLADPIDPSERTPAPVTATPDDGTVDVTSTATHETRQTPTTTTTPTPPSAPTNTTPAESVLARALRVAQEVAREARLAPDLVSAVTNGQQIVITHASTGDDILDGEVAHLIRRGIDQEIKKADDRQLARYAIEISVTDQGQTSLAEPPTGSQTVGADAERLHELLEKAAEFFAAELQSGKVQDAKDAAGYLTRKRGHDIAGALVARWGVGYARRSRHARVSDHLRQEGYTDAELLRTGLLRVNKEGELYSPFYRRLMWPIRDLDGRVTGFTGRTLDPKESKKYFNTASLTPDGTPTLYRKSHVLLGMERLRSSEGPVYISEGPFELQAIDAAHQAGGLPLPVALGTCGTALTEQHVQILTENCDHNRPLIFIFNNDENGAGDRALIKAWDKVSFWPGPLLAITPEGANDLGDIHQDADRGPREVLRQLQSNQRPLVDAVIDAALRLTVDPNQHNKVAMHEQAGELIATHLWEELRRTTTSADTPKLEKLALNYAQRMTDSPWQLPAVGLIAKILFGPGSAQGDEDRWDAAQERAYELHRQTMATNSEATETASAGQTSVATQGETMTTPTTPDEGDGQVTSVRDRQASEPFASSIPAQYFEPSDSLRRLANTAKTQYAQLPKEAEKKVEHISDAELASSAAAFWSEQHPMEQFDQNIRHVIDSFADSSRREEKRKLILQAVRRMRSLILQSASSTGKRCRAPLVTEQDTHRIAAEEIKNLTQKLVTVIAETMDQAQQVRLAPGTMRHTLHQLLGWDGSYLHEGTAEFVPHFTAATALIRTVTAKRRTLLIMKAGGEKAQQLHTDIATWKRALARPKTSTDQPPATPSPTATPTAPPAQPQRNNTANNDFSLTVLRGESTPFRTDNWDVAAGQLSQEFIATLDAHRSAQRADAATPRHYATLSGTPVHLSAEELESDDPHLVVWLGSPPKRSFALPASELRTLPGSRLLTALEWEATYANGATPQPLSTEWFAALERTLPQEQHDTHVTKQDFLDLLTAYAQQETSEADEIRTARAHQAAILFLRQRPGEAVNHLANSTHRWIRSEQGWKFDRRPPSPAPADGLVTPPSTDALERMVQLGKEMTKVRSEFRDLEADAEAAAATEQPQPPTPVQGVASPQQRPTAPVATPTPAEAQLSSEYAELRKRLEEIQPHKEALPPGEYTNLSDLVAQIDRTVSKVRRLHHNTEKQQPLMNRALRLLVRATELLSSLAALLHLPNAGVERFAAWLRGAPRPGETVPDDQLQAPRGDRRLEDLSHIQRDLQQQLAAPKLNPTDRTKLQKEWLINRARWFDHYERNHGTPPGQLIPQDSALVAGAPPVPNIIAAYTDLIDELRRDANSKIKIHGKNDPLADLFHRAATAYEQILAGQPATNTYPQGLITPAVLRTAATAVVRRQKASPLVIQQAFGHEMSYDLANHTLQLLEAHSIVDKLPDKGPREVLASEGDIEARLTTPPAPPSPQPHSATPPQPAPPAPQPQHEDKLEALLQKRTSELSAHAAKATRPRKDRQGPNNPSTPRRPARLEEAQRAAAAQPAAAGHTYR